MSDKRGRMVGERVGNEEVLAQLGHPSEWARHARKLEREARLGHGSDLNISGIRGYGVRKDKDGGYLGYLEHQLLHPQGVGTSLISDEENERIKTMVLEETSVEIEACKTVLAGLEKSSSAITGYIGDMRRRVEELRASVAPEDADALLQISTINQDIFRYMRLLDSLDPDA